MVPKVHADPSKFGNDSDKNIIENWKKRMHVYGERLKRFPCLVWNVGRDDPRKLIHAFKVGLSLTLVSLLYILEPLFEGVGQNAIWAVMTVVVVFEFTAGIVFYPNSNSLFCTFPSLILWKNTNKCGCNCGCAAVKRFKILNIVT